jgi:hypothetical protein
MLQQSSRAHRVYSVPDSRLLATLFLLGVYVLCFALLVGPLITIGLSLDPGAAFIAIMLLAFVVPVIAYPHVLRSLKSPFIHCDVLLECLVPSESSFNIDSPTGKTDRSLVEVIRSVVRNRHSTLEKDRGNAQNGILQIIGVNLSPVDYSLAEAIIFKIFFTDLLK